MTKKIEDNGSKIASLRAWRLSIFNDFSSTIFALFVASWFYSVCFRQS